MDKILIVSKKEQNTELFKNVCKKISVETAVNDDLQSLFSEIKTIGAKLILVDLTDNIGELEAVIKKIKLNTETADLSLVLLVKQGYSNLEILRLANAITHEPINEAAFTATIFNQLKTKNTISNLVKSNNELSKSLIQINSLYNTSTKLAGTLDKDKLIKIMLEGLDLSLSFSLVYVLFFDTNGEVRLIVDSLNAISTRFEEALKLRATLSYKNLFENKKTPFEIKAKKIKTNKIVKNQFSEYDLSVFKYDSMFSPIQIGEKFFGVVEIFREKEFSSEDATCFQTLISQVALPIESAILYEEIKATNTKLEKLERLKSEFISIVSHELRTPLTSMKTSLDIILSGKAGEINQKITTFVETAKRNVIRLSGIINDLLDLSKAEAGHMEFNLKFYNINSNIEFVAKTFESLAKEKKIELKLNLDKNLEPLYIDDKRIEQVLANLVSNALKFTNEDGQVTVSSKKVNASEIDKTKVFESEKYDIKGEYALISIKDSGIGIAPSDLSKVFDKFQQIENSLSRKTGGTGLGLSIAKQLIESHNGFIWIESEINKGSEFFFAIPIISKKQSFFKDLEIMLKNAKNKNSSLGFVMIEEQENPYYSLIKDIRDEKFALTRKSNETKTFFDSTENKKVFMTYIKDADKFALDFVEKKVQAYLGKVGCEAEKCDILFSKSVFPHDGTNIDDLIKNTKSKLKKIH